MAIFTEDKKVSQLLGLRHGQQPHQEGYLPLNWQLEALDPRGGRWGGENRFLEGDGDLNSGRCINLDRLEMLNIYMDFWLLEWSDLWLRVESSPD